MIKCLPFKYNYLGLSIKNIDSRDNEYVKKTSKSQINLKNIIEGLRNVLLLLHMTSEFDWKLGNGS